MRTSKRRRCKRDQRETSGQGCFFDCSHSPPSPTTDTDCLPWGFTPAPTRNLEVLRDSFSWGKPTMSWATVSQRSWRWPFSHRKEVHVIMSAFCWTARKKATYDKFGEDGLKGGIPLDAINTAAWSTQYVYHGKPEKTFTQFFGGNNPFAGESDDLCSSRVHELQCVVLARQTSRWVTCRHSLASCSQEWWRHKTLRLRETSTFPWMIST